jgi:hypothetical protein
LLSLTVTKLEYIEVSEPTPTRPQRERLVWEAAMDPVARARRPHRPIPDELHIRSQGSHYYHLLPPRGDTSRQVRQQDRYPPWYMHERRNPHRVYYPRRFPLDGHPPFIGRHNLGFDDDCYEYVDGESPEPQYAWIWARSPVLNFSAELNDRLPLQRLLNRRLWIQLRLLSGCSILPGDSHSHSGPCSRAA